MCRMECSSDCTDCATAQQNVGPLPPNAPCARIACCDLRVWRRRIRQVQGCREGRGHVAAEISIARIVAQARRGLYGRELSRCRAERYFWQEDVAVGVSDVSVRVLTTRRYAL